MFEVVNEGTRHMENNTITKFKWFWAWNDAAEESWLEEMSKKGYHLTSFGFPGFYNFVVSGPKHYVYRLDYQILKTRDKNEYFQLFKDAGWDHIGEMSGWQYFRKEVRAGETPEIFTDTESKVAKYKRLLAFLGILYCMNVALFVSRVMDNNPYTWWTGIQIVILIIILLMTYAILRLLLRVRQLKKLQ